jgi:hypothetical protein
MPFLAETETNIGDKVEILSKEFKVGDLLSIYHKNRSSGNDDLRLRQAGYLIGTCNNKEYYPNIRGVADRTLVVLCEIDPAEMGSYTWRDWRENYNPIYMDSILTVDKCVPEKDILNSTGPSVHFI